MTPREWDDTHYAERARAWRIADGDRRNNDEIDALMRCEHALLSALSAMVSRPTDATCADCGRTVSIGWTDDTAGSVTVTEVAG